ncbi:MAG: DUF72 domain-containing protein, partial [Betaproteobacteria bacterium]
VRHESFATESFIALLRKHGIALVVADTAGKWPYMEDVTGNFMYLRLHGDKALYASGYTEAALERWATRIRRWKGGAQPGDARRVSDERAPSRKSRDVYVYFDNDVKVRAPFDADSLARKLGVKRADASFTFPDRKALKGAKGAGATPAPLPRRWGGSTRSRAAKQREA